MCAHQEEKAFIPCRAKTRDPESLSKLQTVGEQCRELLPSHCVSSFNFLLIGACNPDPPRNFRRWTISIKIWVLSRKCPVQRILFLYLFKKKKNLSVAIHTAYEWPNEFIFASEVLNLQATLLRKCVKCFSTATNCYCELADLMYRTDKYLNGQNPRTVHAAFKFSIFPLFRTFVSPKNSFLMWDFNFCLRTGKLQQFDSHSHLILCIKPAAFFSTNIHC